MWLAVDRELDLHVALKLVPLGASDRHGERVRREVRLGRTLEHPNLIRIFDLLDLPGQVVVVMEWAPGGTLADRLKNGPLPVDEVSRVAEQVLDALEALHRQGIVHRDVKPSNLLIAGQGRVKLGDLGLARDPADGLELTATATAVGTPAYMAPEVLDGRPATAVADLYALGASLYRLLTGELPFRSDSVVALAREKTATRDLDPRRLRPDCPRPLARLVARLLEVAPADRFPDAGSARAALAAGRVSSRRRRRRGMLAAAAALIAVAGASLGARWLAAAAEPVRVMIVDREVVAESASGRELWRRTYGEPPSFAGLVDLDGSDRQSTMVAITERAPAPAPVHSRLEILDRSGNLLAMLPLDSSPLLERHPDLSDRYQVHGVRIGDADHDGADEVYVLLQHHEWYPTAVFQVTGGERYSVRPLLVNSGGLNQPWLVDVDGDGADEVVVSGLNNPLGYQAVVAVLEPFAIGAAATSPDLVLEWQRRAHGAQAPMRSYVVLGQAAGPPLLEPSASGTLVLRQLETLQALAPNGLPVDLTATTTEIWRFWEDVARVAGGLATGGPWPPVGELPHDLQSSAFDLARDLAWAHALAQSGRRAAAADLLRETVVRHPEATDPWLRLGEMLLLDGRYREGAEALRQALTTGRDGRSPFDATLLLGLDGAFRLDGAGFEQRAAELAAVAYDYQNLIGPEVAALWHFLNEEAASPSLDERPTPPHFKPGAVLRRWAALERGADPRQVLDETLDLVADREIEPLARLLAAAAQLALGDAAAARREAEVGHAALRRRGRTSLEWGVWLPLADDVLGDALAAAGRVDEAAELHRRAREAAPLTRLGR